MDDDLDFLKWIYERMVQVHGENINVDYMIRFKKILIKMDVTREKQREKTTVKTISTGEPSTLGTYLKIAKFFGEKAEQYIQAKIDKADNGEDEIVIADEGQVMHLLNSLAFRPMQEKE